MFENVLYPVLTGFLGVAATKVWDLVKTKDQKKIDDATAKAAEIDTEVKASEYYKSLLDDLAKRLEQAIQTIQQQDEKIKSLLIEVEHLTDELRKYKQLSGKLP